MTGNRPYFLERLDKYFDAIFNSAEGVSLPLNSSAARKSK